MFATGSLYVFLCALSALLSAGVGAYALTKRVPGALAFGLSALSQSFWTLGHTAEFLTESLEGKLFWDNLQFFGTLGWVVGFFAFASEYTNQRFARSLRVWAFTAAVFGPYLGLVLFAPLHPWIRPWAVLAQRGDRWVLDYPFTAYTWIAFAYFFLLFVASIGFLLRQAAQARTRRYRTQNLIIVFGTLAPLIGNTLTLLDVSFTVERDTSPITFGIANLLIGWGLFRHQLLDLVPIARDLVVENLRAAVVVIDAEGRIIDMNPSARARLARNENTAIGKTAAAVLGPWADVLQTPNDPQSQGRLVVADPTTEREHFEVSMAPVLDRSGVVQGQVIVAYDVSQLKVAEQELVERNEQLERLNRELDAFSFSISHDLRAPLRAIEGFARILREDRGRELGDEGNKYLSFIDASVKRMQVLIGALLDLARLSRRSIEREQVALGEMVRDVMTELQPELEGRNVDLVVMDLPPCSADPRLLRQVLANLLSNALKFSRGRSPARIEVGYLAEPDQFTYFVRDNGVGFDMQNADRLFGVFQRFHDASEFEGNGVGLATVNRIVNRHGGRLWAEAVPDQGATLYFTLGS